MKYLYTGCDLGFPILFGQVYKFPVLSSICFAPLTSTYNFERDAALAKDHKAIFQLRTEYNASKATKIDVPSDEEVFWTSVKSMYKLCDSKLR